jgi:SAM-dependent methyltransferase
MQLTPEKLQSAYNNGENITALLREQKHIQSNTAEIIETAYDLQTGSYVDDLLRLEQYQHKIEYGGVISSLIQEHTQPRSVLEAGVGEGTTLAFVLDALKLPEASMVHGFDISWSRTACARRFLSTRGHEVRLCVAAMTHLPYADDSFDVVYTSHSLEPNGGSEAPLLAELFRVTSRFLLLFEPGYELASRECQEHMERHGYVRDLPGHAKSLGMKVTRHELISCVDNPLNPTAVTVIEKKATAASAQPSFVCPQWKTTASSADGVFFSQRSMRAYPVIGGIPCLRPETGVLASKLLDYLPDSSRD